MEKNISKFQQHKKTKNLKNKKKKFLEINKKKNKICG
jgi:hypothetical protein